MKMDVKFPVGISNYPRIITEGYYYIDKTEYIRKLEKNSYQILLRPRRFGKTLFASMLRTYYDINKIDDFDELFGNTYIGKNKTSLANKYHILYFNFSGLDTRNSENLEHTFLENIKVSINLFLEYYNLDFNTNFDDIGTIHGVIQRFLAKLSLKQVRLYIIIDEYDHFANAMLTNKDELTKITNKDGFIRAFYEVLKTHTDTVVERIFITGVTSITLDSLTSGFNIAENISNLPDMNESIGFTRQEVVRLLDDIGLECKSETLELFTENYNGYLFSKAQERVYNSNMIMYYLNRFQRLMEVPESLVDPNIISDYKKISSMFNLFPNVEIKEEKLRRLMENETISAKLTTSFSLETEFTSDDFTSLLFYLGLVTIEKPIKENIYEFKTPNKVIHDVFYDYYIAYIRESYNVSEYMINNALSAIDDVTEQLEKDILSIGECTSVAIVFVGKTCKYHMVK